MTSTYICIESEFLPLQDAAWAAWMEAGETYTDHVKEAQDEADAHRVFVQNNGFVRSLIHFCDEDQRIEPHKLPYLFAEASVLKLKDEKVLIARAMELGQPVYLSY